MIVAVVGKGRDCPAGVDAMASVVGIHIAQAGHIVVTGGLGGVMLAAAQGAVANGGTAIGLVPEGHDPDPAFPGLILRTGLPATVRNVVTASAADAMLALYGSHGTMQEVAVALDRGIPIAAVETARWREFGLETLDVEGVELWLSKSLS